jgi:hypothetical protein
MSQAYSQNPLYASTKAFQGENPLIKVMSASMSHRLRLGGCEPPAPRLSFRVCLTSVSMGARRVSSLWAGERGLRLFQPDRHAVRL